MPLLDIVINRDFRFGCIFLNKVVPVTASCDTAYYRHTGIPPNTMFHASIQVASDEIVVASVCEEVTYPASS